MMCAALVVLVIAGVWLASRDRKPTLAQTVVPVTTYPGNQRDPCFSPDGNQVAFSWDGEKGDNFDIYVKLLGEPNALRPLPTLLRIDFRHGLPTGSESHLNVLTLRVRLASTRFHLSAELSGS